MYRLINEGDGYVQDPKRVEARMMEYAKLLRVEKKVREILGVWL